MKLVDRAKRIVFSPKAEWQVIDLEPATWTQLYTGYIMPLAAIGPISQVIGYSIVGVQLPFAGTHRISLLSTLPHSLVSYVLTLLAAYGIALVIDGLAPVFNAQRSHVQALKLTAYSMTAWWLARIFLLVPALSALRFLGLYSLYLLYLGLPVLLKPPRGKSVTYTVVVAIAGTVVLLLLEVIAGRFLPVPTAGLTVP
jgi:hypothetical protein